MSKTYLTLVDMTYHNFALQLDVVVHSIKLLYLKFGIGTIVLTVQSSVESSPDIFIANNY